MFSMDLHTYLAASVTFHGTFVHAWSALGVQKRSAHAYCSADFCIAHLKQAHLGLSVINNVVH